MCLIGSQTMAFESLTEQLGEPSLELTDSVLISVRCGGLGMAMIAPHIIAEHEPTPDDVPEGIFEPVQMWMPFVHKHLNLISSFRENPRIVQSAKNYMVPRREQERRDDFEFCMMWAYWNIQKYGSL